MFSGGFRGGRAGSAPPPHFGQWTEAVTHGHVSWCFRFWSFYCKTWYTEYSKWLPPVAFWLLRVHQIRFPPELCPGPHWGAYSTPPGPLAGLRGHTSKGEEEGRDRGKGENKGRSRELEGPAPHFANSWLRPWMSAVLEMLVVVSHSNHIPTNDRHVHLFWNLWSNLTLVYWLERCLKHTYTWLMSNDVTTYVQYQHF